MRVLIELENEQEKVLVTDKIARVKEIFDKDIEIVYTNGKKNASYSFGQLQDLKWDMGKKLYKDRDSLYDR